jgi:surface protein
MKTHLYLKSRPPFLSSGPSRWKAQLERIRAAEELQRVNETVRRRKRDEMLDARAAAMAKTTAAGQGRFARFKSKVKGLLGPTAKEWARMEKEREGEENEQRELRQQRERELRQQRETEERERKRLREAKELERKRLREAKELERKRLREAKELERKRLMEKWEAGWELEARYGTDREYATREEKHRLLTQGRRREELDEMMKTWEKARQKRYRQIWAEMANRDKEPSKAAVRALFAAANRKGKEGGDNPMSRALALATSRVRTARFTVARIVVPNNRVLKMWVDQWCKFQQHKPGPRHISNWDTSQITNMSYLFHDKKAFNDDISGWDTSNVTDMRGMFSGASAFNQDIGSWKTHKVTDMSGMFRGASAFNQDIGGWGLSLTLWQALASLGLSPAGSKKKGMPGDYARDPNPMDQRPHMYGEGGFSSTRTADIRSGEMANAASSSHAWRAQA